MKNGDTSIHSTGLTKEEMEGIGHKFHQGLTKREYFAAMAMQAYISGNPAWTDGLNEGSVMADPEEVAEEAITYADALLKALEEW